ncbi:MAG: hypothetical protein IH796_12385 [Deltaproteobacteria bacterium]|nr:hypothetical protein [Deltaproteobacteria bacterium]
MKEKLLIFQGDPCLMCLDDPTIQTVTDAQAHGQIRCKNYSDRRLCAPPRFGCIKMAGLKVARCVLQCHDEVTEQNLAIEIERFNRFGPLPPEQLEAYMDTSDYGWRHITDPALIVQRVAGYARKVLDLKPGEQVLRSTEDPLLLKSRPKSE